MTRGPWRRSATLSCPEVVELVTDWLEGALDPVTAERVQLHLAGCDGCDAYVEQLRTTIGSLAALPAPEPSDEVRGALLAAFRDWSADRPR